MFKKNILKYSSLLFFSFLLLFFVYHIFLSKEHKNLLFEISLSNHLISAFFLLSTFLVSGFELKYVYNKTKQIKFDTYDTLTIPYVINVWGYIIPFQGSFLYLMTYLKLKYKVKIQESLYIYIYIFLISLSFFGFIGFLFLLFTDYVSLMLILIFVNLFMIPVYVYLSKLLMSKIKVKNKLLSQVFAFVEHLISNIHYLNKEKKMIIILILINIILTVLNTLWSYWICNIYNFDIPFFVLFLISIIMKLSMIFKITPGNLGLVQIANGGVFILFGYDASVGIFISLFQFLTLLVFSFPMGMIFTIKNLQYFSFSNLKSIFISKKQ